MAKRMEERFEIKLRGILGPDPTDTKQITILNRIVTWSKYNLTFEVDTRHGEILVNTILEASCNSVVTPGTDDSIDHECTYLEKQQASMYRACAARANFLAQDRPEIQYSVK